MSSTTFLSNPKEMEAWIKALPTANVGETSRQVFKTIVEFNRVDIPNINRIKITESFREPINYIASNLKKYYYDVSFPLTAKNRKIAVLNRELYAELAIAYKIFIETMISGQAGKFDKKLLVIALHRALRYLSLVTYQSAMVYDPYPANIWIEINRLFGFAEQNRIHLIPVKEGKSRSETSTINDLYKQIILFAVISPYRQRQREIQHIYNLLPTWAEKTEINKYMEGQSEAGEFVVQLNSDRPPFHIDLLQNQLNAHSRQLSTHELVAHLRAEFDQLPAESSKNESKVFANKISKHLLRQLIQTLSSAPKREFVRTKLNFELKTAIGLTAIHTLLLRKPELHPEQQEYSPEENAWLVDEGESQKSMYSHTEERLTVGGLGSTSSTESTQPDFDSTQTGSFNYSQSPAWANFTPDTPIDTFVCKTINESAGGYCIHWHGVDTPKIRVGEIIGIQSATNLNQFGIGISRWMKNIPGVGLQVGLEMISPGSIPVTVKNDDSQRNPSDAKQKALLLPELKSSGKSASLIVSSMLFKVGDTLSLRSSDDADHGIRLTRLLESTGAFSQFQFVYQTSGSRKDSSDNETDEDFDNIWSAL